MTVLGTTLPWSWKASMVSGGIVFTVIGPISSSTYIVSLYAGFFVDVEAQRHRCGEAPLLARNSQRSSEKSRSYARRQLAFAIASFTISSSVADLVEALVGIRVHRERELAPRDRGGSPPPATPLEPAGGPGDSTYAERKISVTLIEFPWRSCPRCRDPGLRGGSSRRGSEVDQLWKRWPDHGSPRVVASSERPQSRRSRPCRRPRPILAEEIEASSRPSQRGG